MCEHYKWTSWYKKNTTSASCRVSRPPWALVGAGCSNQLQVAQGQGPVRDCALVQAAIGCWTLLLLVPKMVLTLCNLHWCCFSCHQWAQRPHLHLYTINIQHLIRDTKHSGLKIRSAAIPIIRSHSTSVQIVDALSLHAVYDQPPLNDPNSFRPPPLPHGAVIKQVQWSSGKVGWHITTHLSYSVMYTEKGWRERYIKHTWTECWKADFDYLSVHMKLAPRHHWM